MCQGFLIISNHGYGKSLFLGVLVIVVWTFSLWSTVFGLRSMVLGFWSLYFFGLRSSFFRFYFWTFVISLCSLVFWSLFYSLWSLVFGHSFSDYGFWSSIFGVWSLVFGFLFWSLFLSLQS